MLIAFRLALILCVVGALLNAVNGEWLLAGLLAFVSFGLATQATGRGRGA